MRFKKTDAGYLDNNTGLIWKEQDEPKKLNYKEALKLTNSTWCLPTVSELLSIVDYTKDSPATSLPGILMSFYGSATPDNCYETDAWGVNFRFSYSYTSNKREGHYIRLILRE